MFHRGRGGRWGAGWGEPYCNYQEKPGRHEPGHQNRILITHSALIYFDAHSKQLKSQISKDYAGFAGYISSVYLIKVRLKAGGNYSSQL